MQYDDDRIDALVRAMRRDQDEAAAAIPAAVVHAYLTGRATAAQKTEVRRALSVSPQFRAELIDLANYLETLSSEAAASAYEAATAPASVPAAIAARPVAHAVTPSVWQRFTAAVRERLTMPRLLVAVPALTVAVLLVTLLPQVTWSPIVAPTATTSVDASRFTALPGLSRGEGELDPEQAALRALHQCVRAREGAWEIDAPSQGDRGTRLATVHIVNAWRHKMKTLALVLPEGERLPEPGEAGTAAGQEVCVWILALPDAGATSVSLQAFTLAPGASMALRWDGVSRRSVLVATYLSGGRYHASPCVALDMGAR